MEIVVDTNVFIDALFSSGDEAALVLKNESLGLYSFVMSEKMVDELAREWAGHLGDAGLVGDRAMGAMRRLARCLLRSRRVNPGRSVNCCSDPTDNEFAACAIEAGVNHLVTSNVRHFPHGNTIVLNRHKKPISFMTPKQFNLAIMQLQMERGL